MSSYKLRFIFYLWCVCVVCRQAFDTQLFCRRKKTVQRILDMKKITNLQLNSEKQIFFMKWLYIRVSLTGETCYLVVQLPDNEYGSR